jgi:hypothetical protein
MNAAGDARSEDGGCECDEPISTRAAFAGADRACGAALRWRSAPRASSMRSSARGAFAAGATTVGAAGGMAVEWRGSFESTATAAVTDADKTRCAWRAGAATESSERSGAGVVGQSRDSAATGAFRAPAFVAGAEAVGAGSERRSGFSASCECSSLERTRSSGKRSGVGSETCSETCSESCSESCSEIRARAGGAAAGSARFGSTASASEDKGATDAPKGAGPAAANRAGADGAAASERGRAAGSLRMIETARGSSTGADAFASPKSAGRFSAGGATARAGAVGGAGSSAATLDDALIASGGGAIVVAGGGDDATISA